MKTDNQTKSSDKKGRSAIALAEAIILQSIEDLWSERERPESLAFFTGDGFGMCAQMAGMDVGEQAKMLALVQSVY